MTNSTSEIGAFIAFQNAVKAIGFHIWTGNSYCHYTDINGLKSILESNEIWLSDHRFLNDSSEHLYGQNLAIEIIDTFTQLEQDIRFLSILKEVRQDIIEACPVFYIASMSLAQDRLDQWKGYGRTNESVCLIIENDFSLGHKGVITQLPSVEPIQVIYNLEAQTERLKKVISIFREIFINNPCKVSDTFSLWKRDLLYLVGSQLIRFKNQEYSSEEEVRLVLSATSPVFSSKTLRHRVSNGRLIPYVTTKNPALPQGTKLPLKAVIVGPLVTQDSVVRSIEVFLSNMGYNDTLVKTSAVPFRG